MLADYRKLSSTWETKKQRAKLYLSISEAAGKVKSRDEPLAVPAGRSDRQIADDILVNAKL